MSTRLLVSAAALLFATGCAELQQFLPTVTFDTLRVNDIDFERADVDFVFQVDNPNPVQVSLASFDYGLGLEGIELLTGDDADGFVLDAAGASELSLPIELGWDDAWSAVQATRGLDTVQFGLDGHFGFDTPLGLAELPYAENGSFPAVRRPTFAYKKLRVQGLDLLTQEATLALDLDVDNAHASKLDFANLKYKVKMGGTRVATGTFEGFAVDGATAKTITLPLTVDLLNVGSEVVDAIANRRRLNLGFVGDVDVAVPFLEDTVLPLHLDEDGQITVE